MTIQISGSGSSRRVLRTTLAIAFSAVMLGVTSPASAQGTNQNQIIAEKLFQDARALVQKGDYKDACPKFQESQRLDPSGGTAINLALCYEGEGKTASAWAAWKEALAFAIKDGRQPREQMARDHIAKLEPTLHQIVITVPEGVPETLKVEVDKVELPKVVWGSQSPIDQGHHVIDVSAPTYYPAKVSVDVGPNDDVVRVEVPKLKPKPPEVIRKEEKDAYRMPPGRRTAAYLALGTGVAGIAVGSLFGVLTLAKRSDSTGFCQNGNDNLCSAEGVRLNEQAIQYSWISTAGFGVGILGAAVGTYLLLVKPSPAAPPKQGSVALPNVHVDFARGGIALTQVW
jgi:hypothetical protein